LTLLFVAQQREKKKNKRKKSFAEKTNEKWSFSEAQILMCAYIMLSITHREASQSAKSFLGNTQKGRLKAFLSQQSYIYSFYSQKSL
jgi:hypothetical protein